MIKSSTHKMLFDGLLQEHLAWHKRARIGYRKAGLKRAELDQDALIILMIEVAEIVWRHDLDLAEIVSTVRDMISDIEKKNPEQLQ